MIIATIIPVNPTVVYASANTEYGLTSTTSVLRIILFILTFASFIFNAKKTEAVELKYMAFAFAILFIGYLILTVTDNFVFLIFGIAALLAGSIQFVANLHKLYLWK